MQYIIIYKHKQFSIIYPKPLNKEILILLFSYQFERIITLKCSKYINILHFINLIFLFNLII